LIGTSAKASPIAPRRHVANNHCLHFYVLA
jgi:hypothetical protein